MRGLFLSHHFLQMVIAHGLGDPRLKLPGAAPPGNGLV